MSEPIFDTVIYKFPNQEQRKEVIAKAVEMMGEDDTSKPSVCALSRDHEMIRLDLIEQAMDRYDDHYDLRDAIGDIIGAVNVDLWSWDEYEKDPTTYHNALYEKRPM